MILRKLLIAVICLLSACLVAAPGSAAQGQAAVPSGSQADGMAILMRTANFLAQAGQFSFRLSAGYDVLQETGQKIEFGEVRQVTLVRPDRMRVDTERSDGEKAQAIFNGQEIIVYSPGDKVYATAGKPGDLDSALRYLVNDLQLRLPLSLMYVRDFPAELERRMLSVDVVEKVAAMDVPCIHLAGRTDTVDFQFWIPTEGDPLPRRVVMTYKLAEGQPQFWANFTEWNLSPNPPQGFFSFTPPEGVQRIAFLAELEVAKPDVKKVKKGGKK
ncbi:DUF2092 domain-containing protein [Syntrophobacter fumaroxidans]|uniref:DUF2092 domain-containing protein n=1 Tax=Syntrophobacter fumaroxidans (strain DSM 10017 / MPOB) TaxID=335543 RepID=A0LFT2_SYNFM|nr:DUF2092 domain-containing protein [Syntrophobacter fumaroxidans]ABK16284.1 conserved hypothetical protein [Syntrophobacter fumaroxidans MPOB]